ncbi:uncharacterized protein LOC126374479 [Pectinophora gossypiella]|uniref:uncharacterized protein LOC126374479 n=1 Tax=Pectinophora gossypiella TaxID=13191 RepID=UPI00214E77AE|nr:uncharacterized protein LOC126374479 [Pectinophora gossypiella]
MSAHIAGFICALVLAAFVVAWITYCMFFRERHKSEHHQYNISDLRHKNYQLAQEQETKEVPPKKELVAGVFILPSRHKHKDEDYEKRPDYPESPPPALQAGADQLVEIFNDSVADADVHYKDGIFEIDSNAQYHSDV